MSYNDRYSDLDRVWDDRTFKAYANFTDHPVRTSAVWLAAIIAVVLILTLIGNAFGIADIYWQAERAKITVNPRVTQSTYSTSNALANIAYFHNQCNDILALNAQVQESEQTLKQDQALFNATPASNPIAQQQAGNQVTQDESNLEGQKAQLANDVQDYDAKSATQTSNPFKAHNLPYRITVNPTTGLVQGQINCH